MEAVAEADGESDHSPLADGLADSVELDPGAESDHEAEAEGAGTLDPVSPSLPLSLPATEVVAGCSPLTEAEAA